MQLDLALHNKKNQKKKAEKVDNKHKHKQKNRNLTYFL